MLLPAANECTLTCVTHAAAIWIVSKIYHFLAMHSVRESDGRAQEALRIFVSFFEIL